MAKKKNPAAVALGRLGGKARLVKLSRKERQRIARRAIRARWAKQRRKKRGAK